MAKKATSRRSASKKAVSKKAATKKSVNKSDAIREHMQKHPSDGPSAISLALAKRGIKVTPAFVSTVKSNDRRKTGGDSRKARGGKALDDATLRALTNAKKLVEETGSVSAAKAALDNYSRLLD